MVLQGLYGSHLELNHHGQWGEIVKTFYEELESTDVRIPILVSGNAVYHGRNHVDCVELIPIRCMHYRKFRRKTSVFGAQEPPIRIGCEDVQIHVLIVKEETACSPRVVWHSTSGTL